MATEGPRYPGTTANLSNAGTSESAEAWVNPGNVASDNATEATITAATYDSPDISQILVASNFGFTVPDGSTILGITVEIDRRSIIASSGKDFRVQLAKGTTFASLVGTNKAVPATIWPTTSTVATYGGASDLWGTTWTPAEIRAASFALFLSAQANIANADVGADFTRISVAYTPPSVTGTGDITVERMVLDATGSVITPVTGSGAITADEATIAATGAESFTGTGAITADEAQIAATGNVDTGPTPVTGTGAITADEATVSGTGAESFTGTGAITADEAQIAATGAESFTGTGAITADEGALAGAGLQTIPVTGTGAVAADEAVLASIGSVAVPVTGTGAIVAEEAQVSGTGAGTVEIQIAGNPLERPVNWISRIRRSGLRPR